MSDKKTDNKIQITVATIAAFATICAALIGLIGAIVALYPYFQRPVPTIVTPTVVLTTPVGTDTLFSTDTADPLNQPTSTLQLTPIDEVIPTIGSSDVIFIEKFDDNRNNWPLDNKTRLSNGKLAVTVDKGNWIWLTIPNVKVDGDFYIQAEMSLSEGHACFSQMGFAIGEKDLSQNSFLFTGGGCSGGGDVGFYDNNSELFTTVIDGIALNRNVTYNIGLEFKDGLYTFYIGGDSTDSAPVEVDGQDIGIFAWRPDSVFVPADSTFFFDNIVLKKER